MYNTTITIIWLISLIICGVLSYFSGRGSMRIIEITSNERVREMPNYSKANLDNAYKQFYGEEEAAFVPGEDEPSEPTKEGRKNILYKTFKEFE